jgi:hypothetical protein
MQLCIKVLKEKNNEEGEEMEEELDTGESGGG